MPSLPSGYDVAKPVHVTRADCQLTVGFDRQRSHIPRFIVQLHYQSSTGPVQWKEVARMDHNETAVTGHDVYREGLHVDIARRSNPTVHLQLSHGQLPSNRGKVIRGCVNYFIQETDYFIDVYEEHRQPGGPPRWSPDGGDPTCKFICANPVEEDMSGESPTEDVLSVDELTELLADTTGTTPEEIEQGATNIEIAPPEEATVVNNE